MREAGTRFAILQRSLEVPDVEKLKRAFRSVKGLTDSDAHTLANDGFGILVNNLSPTDAMTLQGALRAEGVETAVVLQTDLRSCRRLSLSTRWIVCPMRWWFTTRLGGNSRWHGIKSC